MCQFSSDVKYYTGKWYKMHNILGKINHHSIFTKTLLNLQGFNNLFRGHYGLAVLPLCLLHNILLGSDMYRTSHNNNYVVANNYKILVQRRYRQEPTFKAIFKTFTTFKNCIIVSGFPFGECCAAEGIEGSESN